MLLFVTITIISIMIVIGCDGAVSGCYPPIYTRNIQFDPTSGRIGDIITIIGENFLLANKMQLVLDQSRAVY